ncbi:unnamed protein product, partial [Ectocarpus sp. 12 AP-2014]
LLLRLTTSASCLPSALPLFQTPHQQHAPRDACVRPAASRCRHELPQEKPSIRYPPRPKARSHGRIRTVAGCQQGPHDWHSQHLGHGVWRMKTSCGRSVAGWVVGAAV